MFFQYSMNSDDNGVPAELDPLILFHGQVRIFSCLTSVSPLIFYIRVIYRANMEIRTGYFPCFAYVSNS
jgi:hypothetical protein